MSERMPDRATQAAMSPEQALAWHLMAYAQRHAPEGDARRTVPTKHDRQAAHAAIAALRAAGWRIVR